MRHARPPIYRSAMAELFRIGTRLLGLVLAVLIVFIAILLDNPLIWAFAALVGAGVIWATRPSFWYTTDNLDRETTCS